MIEILELEQTVNAEKDTWILKLPDEVCRREGVAKGTMISLTYRNGGVKTSIIRPPSQELQDLAEKILEEDQELFEELRRIGD
jgi:hypothetical protein